MTEITLTSILFFIAIITWIAFILSEIYLRLLLKRLERTDAELQQLCKDTLIELDSLKLIQDNKVWNVK